MLHFYLVSHLILYSISITLALRAQSMTVIHKLVQFHVELHHLAFWIKMKRLTKPNWDVKKSFVFFPFLWGITQLSLRHVPSFNTV